MQLPPFREVAELGGALGLIFIYAKYSYRRRNILS
jgi:hypothetical protein